MTSILETAEPSVSTAKDELLAAIAEFIDMVGVEAVRADAFQVPIAVFTDRRVTGARVAADSDNAAHMWLSGNVRIGGHSFSIYSVDLPLAEEDAA